MYWSVARSENLRHFELRATWGQRSGVADAVVHPPPECGVGPEPCCVDPEPAGHLPATHHEAPYMELIDESLGLSGIDADQQTALTAGTHGQVAVDQEPEAAEHALLGQAGFT